MRDIAKLHPHFFLPTSQGLELRMPGAGSVSWRGTCILKDVLLSAQAYGGKTNTVMHACSKTLLSCSPKSLR